MPNDSLTSSFSHSSLYLSSSLFTPFLFSLFCLHPSYLSTRFQRTVQAKVLTAVSSVDEADVDEELASAKKAPCVIYTYDLSPFSVEAINVLESTGAKFEKRSLGAEWFLLGPRQSLVRAKLLEQTGQSSLPHIFIGGEHIGGLSTGTPGLNSLAESGELTTMLKKAKALK